MRSWNCRIASAISRSDEAGPKKGTGRRTFRTLFRKEARYNAAPKADPSWRAIETPFQSRRSHRSRFASLNGPDLRDLALERMNALPEAADAG